MPPKEENKYIPAYIKNVPAFLRDDNTDPGSTDYLSHHRNSSTAETSNAEPKIGRGIQDDFIIEEFQVNVKGKLKKKKTGLCQNCCGKHDTRDCLERPKAKNKTSDIDAIQASVKGKRSENVDYDGKRDRWFGYDASEYRKQVENWKAKEPEEVEEREFDTDEEIELQELGLWEEYTKDNVKKAEGENTVRLREDRAVYLRNLGGEVTYDPKSRMIQDDSTGYYNDENLFVRHRNGEALLFETGAKRSAWEGKPMNETKPSVAITEKIEMKKKKTPSAAGLALKNSLFDKYNAKGGEEEVEEEQEEFDVELSRYTEDVLVNGHTSVYGSLYKDGKWGYRCCGQTDPKSACSGEMDRLK